MAYINKTIKDLEECLSASCRGYKPKVYCPHRDEEWDIMRDALALLKEQEGLALALEQANATINYLNEEKEKTIKEIEERRAFNLKCDGQPEWLRKGIDVGLNTALDILKGKDGEQE